MYRVFWIIHCELRSEKLYNMGPFNFFRVAVESFVSAPSTGMRKPWTHIHSLIPVSHLPLSCLSHVSLTSSICRLLESLPWRKPSRGNWSGLIFFLDCNHRCNDWAFLVAEYCSSGFVSNEDTVSVCGVCSVHPPPVSCHVKCTERRHVRLI